MKNKTILIFDDDSNILEVCSIILSDAGYDVRISETSHDIIEKVSELTPDVILMDNWIPDIGGIEATRLLKKHPEFGKIPVIYISANNDIHTLAENAGADAYLAKPFDIADLEETVERMLAKTAE
ncbi:response regulator receiver domain-containing protein [Sphingobacterium allocomposti]|jgi:CheY-like chemotaxis protein|uniref:Response regulator receiver domain-containing protein n=1 Tax=Sphingobacterium allocomposti TaxID=415956 RepID=A0A5S5D6A5_9SPHI|nr:response regulator [Sphingobacterium composti Yoo et al. 2007 non Ten et al. 2007]TYP90964.1 response regulator receiver domain-containing protein [Sphingobacterium composti Yoo et al. 2007 non Ten et al. 2007]HLS94506.1 response regulator [Sphingobacterium sp.]